MVMHAAGVPKAEGLTHFMTVFPNHLMSPRFLLLLTHFKDVVRGISTTLHMPRNIGTANSLLQFDLL